MASGRLRFVTMIATSLVMAAFVFGLSWFGMRELFTFNIPIKGLIVGGLFDVLFFTLGVMLVFSTGIILYASLFTSPEAQYLLSTPARADRIFATKFQAAVAFSSWAFLILGLPILVAYGIVAGVPAYFYPLLPAYLLGFVLLPGSASALLALLLVRYLPRNRKQVLIWLGVIGCAVVVAWGVQVGRAARQSLVTGKKNEVEGLIGQFALLRHPAMPSHWATTGVMAAARGELTIALPQLALLWSNGLLAYVVAATVARATYRRGFDRLAGGGTGARVYGRNPLDRVMEWSVFYLDKPTRILIVKDFRTFRRDPTQWVLLGVFGGLFLLGAMNYRQLVKNDLATLDRYVVSIINVSATVVLMCAGLSRFIFPLISLEGRKFWILGLLPVNRDQILRGKFVFAATLSTALAEALILTGDILIELPAGAVVAHALTVAAASIGLSAINVGLGAYLPNFRETDPSKIVVGFGGTLNMVLGLMYAVLIVGIMTGPVHAAGMAKSLGEAGGLPPWAFFGLPIGLILAAIAVVVPLRLGGRALREAEF